MLTEPNGCWSLVDKANHCVFPISHMVSQHLSVDSVSQVEGIEVHVKGVHDPIAMVIHDDSARFSSSGFVRYRIR